MEAALCTLVNEMVASFFIPLAFVGALAGIGWIGASYALSGILPEFAQKVRQAPKNILIGLLTFTIGPLVLTMLADNFLGFSC